MAKILWSKYFMKAQGQNIAHKRILEGNKISILFKKMVNYPAPNKLNI